MEHSYILKSIKALELAYERREIPLSVLQNVQCTMYNAHAAAVGHVFLQSP